jgi:hypothetical protein
MKSAQIHVSFISKQVEALVSEATLRSLFSLYGNVVDVTLKKSQFDPVRIFSVSVILFANCFTFRT